MSEVLYVAWRYLAYHRLKTAVLVGSITLILYTPVGLRVLVRESQEKLTARAVVTPLLVGAKGSPLELVLNSLYFRAEVPEHIPFAEMANIRNTGWALTIPLYVRFQSRGIPIVGTTFDYFSFRKLTLASGHSMARLGDCVVGATAARRLEVKPGGAVISSPENVFDLAGVYPLKMRVTGILSRSGGPDDDAIFVDVKTAWIIEGLAHGHDDLAKPEAVRSVLKMDGRNIVSNASVREYNEITDENIDSFHFHGDTATFPVTAVIANPPDQKSSALLMGRYEDPSQTLMVVPPRRVMEELFKTILTIEGFVLLALGSVALGTLATAILVFMLSLRLRQREIETMTKIGGARRRILSLWASEIVLVILISALLAAGLTGLTQAASSKIIQLFLQ